MLQQLLHWFQQSAMQFGVNDVVASYDQSNGNLILSLPWSQ